MAESADSIKDSETVESAEATGVAVETPDQPVEESVAPAAASTASLILLDHHFAIDPSEALEELDIPTAKAFLAEDRRDPARKLYALICSPEIPLRMDVLDVLKGRFIRGILTLVAAAPVDWPPLQRKCMALVYERPLGGSVLGKMAKSLTRVSEYEFPNLVIRPLLRAVSEFESRGITHRAIRADNIYYLDADHQNLVLGDCISAPPGYNQPAIFETVPQSMADPDGRSAGSSADDIYALGCAIVYLTVDSHPCDRMTDDQILASKIEKGSFSTLCTNTRVPVPLLEALRGMLNDEVTQRWGVKEVAGWLNGQRQANPQRKPIIKGDLPFEFLDFEHISPRTLANAMSKNVPEAIKIIKDGELAAWIRRSVHDPNLAEAITATAEATKPHGQGIANSHDFIVAKACTLIDPLGPIRYKGISFMPDSIGTKLAMELRQAKNAQRIAEVITSGIANIWVAAQPGPLNSSRVKTLDKMFMQLRSFLNINEAGYGIERCLYELNDDLPCQSPLLETDFIIHLQDLLPALDEAANRIDPKLRPMDRHISAFIATHHNQNIDPHLKAASSSRDSIRLIGILSLLALLQWRFKIGPLYGLSSWIGGHLEPAISTYHSRTTRREIEREIPRLVRKGSLPDLFDLIDNIEKKRIDMDEFSAAKAEFAEAEYEIRDIENNSPSRRRMYENKGQQFAAMSSLVLAMIIIMVFLIVESV
ncbi:MAG: hypothetical protein RIB59_15380 [Rhodospirillales bacterium]